jgi:quercetin dioxygenase-like cupin family protein
MFQLYKCIESGYFCAVLSKKIYKMKTWLFFLAAFLYNNCLLAQSAGISRRALLQQQLPGTTVQLVRIDEITCGPGEGAPAHFHPCEVYGYVVEGQIEYQVEGQSPVLLKQGDSFREAAGQHIQVFKNALADKPSKFIAMYLAKKDQPVIVLTNDNKK